MVSDSTSEETSEEQEDNLLEGQGNLESSKQPWEDHWTSVLQESPAVEKSSVKMEQLPDNKYYMQEFYEHIRLNMLPQMPQWLKKILQDQTGFCSDTYDKHLQLPET